MLKRLCAIGLTLFLLFAPAAVSICQHTQKTEICCHETQGKNSARKECLLVCEGTLKSITVWQKDKVNFAANLFLLIVLGFLIPFLNKRSYSFIALRKCALRADLYWRWRCCPLRL
jgi:glycopeptide antibiotics resistance protein